MAWSVARLVSSVLFLFHLTAVLEFLRGQVGRLPSYVQVIGLSQTRGLVVLDVSNSVEFHSQVTQCMP